MYGPQSVQIHKDSIYIPVGQVWLPSAESLVLELQVGGGAPVAWSFGTTASTWQTTDASPQLSFQEGESLIRLWASASGLRIRLEDSEDSAGLGLACLSPVQRFPPHPNCRPYTCHKSVCGWTGHFPCSFRTWETSVASFPMRRSGHVPDVIQGTMQEQWV